MAKKIATVGVFAALAMIFSYIEAIIPVNIGVPGVKLGLANLVTVVALYKFGVKEAAFISFVRIVIVGLLFGNAMSLVYSLSGGVLSFCGMIILKRFKGFSEIGVSVFGGVLHNIGQLAAAALMLQTAGILSYLPVLLIAGAATGFIIGILALSVNKILKVNKFAQ